MLHVHGCLYRTTEFADLSRRHLAVGVRVHQPDLEPVRGDQAGRAGRADLAARRERMGANASVSPKASANASISNRAVNCVSTSDAVGAAYTQRREFLVSSDR